MFGLNFVDLGLIVFVLLSSFIGVMRGFTREFLGILSWIGAIILTVYGIHMALPYVTPYIANKMFASIVSGVIIFIIALFIFGAINRLISSRVKGGILGGTDRSLGILFGFGRAVAILVIAFFGFKLFFKTPEKWPEQFKTSRLIVPIAKMEGKLMSMVPKEYLETIGLPTAQGESDESDIQADDSAVEPDEDKDPKQMSAVELEKEIEKLAKGIIDSGLDATIFSQKTPVGIIKDTSTITPTETS